ncbi:MAG: efflux RND transporter periplasmic adaptor subunit [Vicinamibacterales bacterium]
MRTTTTTRTLRAAVTAVLLLSAACARKDAATEAPAVAPAVIEIGHENVVAVETARIQIGPLVSGELKAEHEATVRAKTGGSVLQATWQEGDAVRQGAVLARIEERTLRDAISSAESDLRSAQSSLEWTRKEMQRTESLVRGGALAERDLEIARNAITASEAQVENVRARLASAREQLADATVYAPIGGIIARRVANRGDVVSPGAELYTIVDPTSMRLDASVPSNELVAVKVGATVSFAVRGYPDQTFEGRIERISPIADASTRQVPIFVTVPNQAGRLVAGLFAEGRVLKDARSALVVPESAVNQAGARPWVLAVKQGKVERVEVELGLRDDQTERVELVTGVSEGDQLVVGASQGMTPGTPVRIRQRQGA